MIPYSIAVNNFYWHLTKICRMASEIGGLPFVIPLTIWCPTLSSPWGWSFRGDDCTPGLVDQLDPSFSDVRGLAVVTSEDSLRLRSGSGELFSSWSWRLYVRTWLSSWRSLKSRSTSPRNIWSSPVTDHRVTSRDRRDNWGKNENFSSNVTMYTNDFKGSKKTCTVVAKFFYICVSFNLKKNQLLHEKRAFTLVNS